MEVWAYRKYGILIEINELLPRFEEGKPVMCTVIFFISNGLQGLKRKVQWFLKDLSRKTYGLWIPLSGAVT